MKRVLCFLLSLCLLVALTGCMSQEEREARKEALTALSGDSNGTYSLSNGTMVENQTLYSDGNIIIQLAGITGTPDYPELKLAIRNGSRDTINLSINHLVINGWQVDGWLDLYDVSPRTVTMGTIQCGSSLAECGITDVVTIELGFDIYDGDYDTISSVSSIMETSSLEEVDVNELPDGITLFEEDGVTLKAVNLASGSYGTTVLLCLVNETGRTLAPNATQARCNGDPVELYFYDRVNPGCKRILSEEIYHEDTYETLQMEDSDELTFNLEIQDWDTGIVLHQVEVSLTPGDF